MYTSKVSRCFRLDSSFSETYFVKAVSCEFEWPSIIVDLPAVFLPSNRSLSLACGPTSLVFC